MSEHERETVNLDLWDRLSKTDPAHTKGFQRTGGFKGTAIKPMWAMWRATKEFGPIGQGWGWEEVDLRIESGMVFSKCKVWYRDRKQSICWTGPQWGGTEIMANRKSGAVPDDECFKKSVTDAVVKCLSYIGIGGDVHMGQFDDMKYVEAVTKEIAKDATNKQREEDEAWASGLCTLSKAADSAASIKDLYKKHAERFAAVKARSPDLIEKIFAVGKECADKLAADTQQQAAE